MTSIVRTEKKGDITVVYLSDGTFMVCAGSVEIFESEAVAKQVETLELAEEPEKEEVIEKESEKKPEKEDSDDYWTEEDIEDLTKKELVELIDDEELNIDANEFASVRKLKKVVMKELGI